MLDERSMRQASVWASVITGGFFLLCVLMWARETGLLGKSL
jgi:hypothetical protein